MQVLDEQGKRPIKMWTDGVPVDHGSLDQLRKTASLPFIFKHVAVMPDVHVGIGATVGSVIPTKGAIIPAAVGVDIGCGMIAARTCLTADNIMNGDLKKLRRAIERAVPVGRDDHGQALPKLVEQAYEELSNELFNIGAKHKPVLKNVKKVAPQLGSLGGGNHFIEICLDEAQNVWIMLHSGSRNIGNLIGRHFIELAREDMRVHFINLPDKDLAYLSEGTQHFDDYVQALGWAQLYARTNRQLMLALVTNALEGHLIDMYGPHTPPSVRPLETVANCHHNYVAIENHFGENVMVTRKGAVRARLGDMGIIPGSMGARSYIVRGKGNPESFQSCSHGAGRVMSRTKAFETITEEQFKASVEGVECRTDRGVLDEAPAAYKDIDAVMAAQSDLVDIVHTLKQVVCVKG